ncbi:DUF4398 domain-containing protein [Algiphilus aromaticivorans]|uniref:DUF4398 domain-containing protein n=1 Tax=Algiphilus aromaticivorans TaxID=382454 RepID=UPI0005C223B3|nr:DUF4398 domain-containing protein [Algiphilus aromaticivorans]
MAEKVDERESFLADTEQEHADELAEQVRTLRRELAQAKREDITARAVRRELLNLSEQSPKPPKWLTKRGKGAKAPGVPTLFASDWHWGEVVNEDEIDGSNAFDVDVAHTRSQRMIERATILLREHVVTPDYPGIVYALGGDMVTGDIHEELSVTNEMPIGPTLIDLLGVQVWCIQTLADEFGQVFIPCVTGNHGRMTRKPRAKQRNATNFDWILYSLLDRWFSGDKRVQFYIPEGSDALYTLYGHKYKLTHGDQFRGGDGMIGPIGPITRGDHKKRSRDNQTGTGYDTLLMGHFHTLMQLRRFIVNGSLKGYDEYAFANNFPYEPPQQALWLTHPEHGITISMPVQLGEVSKPGAKDWVSWKSAA